MKHFKDMFRCFQEQGLTGTTSHNQLFPPTDAFMLNLFEKCQVFVFQPIGECSRLDEEGEELKHQRLDAPFNLFSVEMAGDTSVCGNAWDQVPHSIPCIMILEHNNDWIQFFHIKYDSGKEVIMHCANLLNDVVQNLLDRLQVEALGVDETPRVMSYKNPDNPKKKKRIIKDHIFIVAPKKYKKTTAGKKVNWSHRWNVRGHWRQVKGIGKDREGNYCVNGRTWVTESVKGPDDMPLIKKQRVVDDR